MPDKPEETAEIMDSSEAKRLIELERVIERGQQTFIEVGNALAEIRDSRIYRNSHKTFEDYCRERWGWSRIQVHRTIEAAKIDGVLPMGNKPNSERQARPLAKLPPEQQPEAWEKAQEMAKEENKPVTAKHVEKAVKEREKQDKSPTPEEGEPMNTPIKKKKHVSKHQSRDAMRLWGLAWACLDNILTEDLEREQALKEALDYCEQRLKNNQ